MITQTLISKLKSCVLCYKQYKQKFSKKGKQDSNSGAVHGGDQIVPLNHKALDFSFL